MPGRVENPAHRPASADEAERVDVSVLVPVLEGRYLAATIASMRRQEYDGTIEFVFADGASSDDTRAILAPFAEGAHEREWRLPRRLAPRDARRDGGLRRGVPANEDVELAARIEERGGRLVSLDAMAAHYVPRNSPRALARQYFRWGYYRVKTARRHPGALRLSHLGTPALVSALLVAAIPGRSARVRWPRRAARLGSAAYAALLLDTVRRGPGVRTPIDALLIPAVFATMHVSWGAGFLSGCCRFGPPTRALRAVLRRLAGSRRSSRRARA